MRWPQLYDPIENPFSTEPDICAPYTLCIWGNLSGVSKVVLLDTSIRN